MNTGSETDGRGSLASGENSSVGVFLDVFEDLGFCCTRITEEENVDVSTDGMFPVNVFRNTTKER
jgi:hypothetical protein